MLRDTTKEANTCAKVEKAKPNFDFTQSRRPRESEIYRNAVKYPKAKRTNSTGNPFLRLN